MTDQTCKCKSVKLNSNCYCSLVWSVNAKVTVKKLKDQIIVMLPSQQKKPKQMQTHTHAQTHIPLPCRHISLTQKVCGDHIRVLPYKEN